MELDELLVASVKQQASDLHLLPELKPLMRINGVLTTIKDENILPPAETRRLLYSVMSEEQQRSFEEKLVFEMAL